MRSALRAFLAELRACSHGILGVPRRAMRARSVSIAGKLSRAYYNERGYQSASQSITFHIDITVTV